MGVSRAAAPRLHTMTDMLKETLELHRQGRLDEAETGYRALLADNPLDGEVLRLLGIVRRDRGDLVESASLITRAHQLAPEQPGLLLMLGAIHSESGDYRQAREAYERVLTLDPNIAGAHSSLGHLALLTSEPKLAEQHFRTALRATEDPQALTGLGMLALDADDVDNAMKYLTRAADLAPNDPAVAFSLGRGFSKRGMLAFAEQSFQTALRLRPGMPHASNALGQLFINANRGAEAEPHMRALLNARGFELAGLLGLGDAFRAQGKLEEAVEQYRAALERRPDHEAGLQALTWCLVRLGRRPDALQLLDERIASQPQQEDRWRTERAALLAGMGREKDAAADWQVLRDRHPDNPQVASQLAQLRELSGDYDAARALAVETLEKRPDDIDAAFILVRAHLRDGDATAAQTLLDGFSGKPVNESQARRGLHYQGRIFDTLGQYEEAVRHFAGAQQGMAMGLPVLETLPVDYDRVLADPEGAPWKHAPILLVGTPGSGVERIAALLEDHGGLSVLSDRVSGVRNDGFDARAFDHTNSELYDAGIEALREEYLAPLRTAGVDLDKPLIDWIPRWDARFLVFARRFLPGTRVIVVDNDPRDALLNWMAFGWLPLTAFGDIDRGVEWFERAHQHARFVVEHGGLPHLVVNAEKVLADPAGAGAELARFVGVDALKPGARSARVANAVGGLPARFEDGHCERYADTLAAAFARVTGQAATPLV